MLLSTCFLQLGPTQQRTGLARDISHSNSAIMQVARTRGENHSPVYEHHSLDLMS